MKAVRKIAILIIGFVLFIAGFLKLMDPVGAGLVMGDYFRFFHLYFLRVLATPAAVGMALFETLLGAALLTGVWPKKVAVVSGITLGFFTVLTFVLWLLDPPMECGCFGEAIHLTHAQTLLKNLVLDALWCVAFLPFKAIPEHPKRKIVSFGIACVSVVAFCVFSLISLPLVDYTPFHNGTEIGIGEEQLTAQLPFTDTSGVYADSLLLKNQVIVVSVYNPDENVLRKTAQYCDTLSTAGIETLVLVSGDPDEILSKEPSLGPNIYLADRRTLMTLNRSNGGATYVSSGQIVTKWAAAFKPDTQELAATFNESPTIVGIKENTADRNWMQGFLLYVFAVMLLL